LRWLLAAAATLTAIGTAGAVFMPALLAHHHPLLLIGLSPLPRHLVMAATQVAIVPFVLVATARRTLTAMLGYAIGNVYGEDGVGWLHARYPKASGALELLQKAFDAAAPLVIFIAPGPLTGGLAGASRVRWWVYLPLVSAGHALWVTLTYRVGAALSAWIAPIVLYVQTNVGLTTLACAALAGAYALMRRRMRRRGQLAATGQGAALSPPANASDG
jgi:membrane protein DedA with SNARE-associated domain